MSTVVVVDTILEACWSYEYAGVRNKVDGYLCRYIAIGLNLLVDILDSGSIFLPKRLYPMALEQWHFLMVGMIVTYGETMALSESGKAIALIKS